MVYNATHFVSFFINEFEPAHSITKKVHPLVDRPFVGVSGLPPFSWFSIMCGDKSRVLTLRVLSILNISGFKQA